MGIAETPLHPCARQAAYLELKTCRHSLYVIATGYRDRAGRAFDRHYCWCGWIMKVVPTPGA